MPDISRIVVPEFNASSAPAGACNPPTPLPKTVIAPGPVRRIVTPSARRHSTVAAQSAPGEKPLMEDSPSARAESMA
jgi:hypothetical protein